MNRRKLLKTLFGVYPLSAVCLLAKDHDNGRGAGKHRRHPKTHHPGGDQDFNYFRSEHYSAVRRYYHGPSDIPPGLRKKYYRRGVLPRGWERRIRPFPPELVLVLPPPPPYCERGYIDGVAIVYDRRTRIILDSIDLVSAIAGY